MILDVGVAEFDDMLAMNSSVSPMRSCSIESARLLIAGAIRYAHDNGFILPCDMDRALKIIDGVGDWRTADTSQFVPEFAGSYRDLQRRSIGQPAEEFLKRKDIRFIINDDMPSLLDEEDDYRLTEIQDALDDVAALAEAYRPEIEAWCAATNEPLHPEYAMGTATLFGAKMLSDDLNGEQTPDETLEEILATCPADMQTEIRDAINQFSRFLRECGTKELVNRVRTRLGRAASASPTS